MGTIYTFANGATTVLATVQGTPTGVAAWGADVYFTTMADKTWGLATGAPPVPLVSPSTAMPSGPITADASGVYWPTIDGHMVSVSPGGGTATSLCMVPDTVNAVTTDSAFVYWTDQSGGVYQVAKTAAGAMPKILNPPDGITPAYGIVVDLTTSVYFAQGTRVLRVQFPFGSAPTVLASGLVSPRGVATDQNFLYVADHGTPPTANGRILEIVPF
jgi:hypothetical protein